MLKNYILLFLSITYTIILTTLSLISIDANMPPNSDKLLHIVAYTAFTILWFLAFYSLNKAKALRLAIISSLSFGVLIEFLQEYLTKTRQGDIYDVLANAIGTVIAVIIIVIAKKVLLKNKNPLLF